MRYVIHIDTDSNVTSKDIEEMIEAGADYLTIKVNNIEIVDVVEDK